MSGVYQRNRNLSNFEYYNSAIAPRAEVTKLAVSNSIPKAYRFVFAVPMAETARGIVYNIVKADSFYPNTEENVTARKRYLTLAVADCEQLVQDIQCLLSMGLPVKASRVEAIIDDVEKEIKLIKGARNGVKLIGKG